MLHEFDGQISTMDILKKTYETQDLKFSAALLVGCALVPAMIHFFAGKPEAKATEAKAA